MSSMKWPDAIDSYLRDQRQYGRINSENTTRAYRSTLLLHAEDTPDGPVEAGREDIKRTLARWETPNTQTRAHSVMMSFYDWLCMEGHRETNPARQVRKAKRRTPSVYRLTRQETQALIEACETVRERRVILLGLCTGARNGELHQFQGRHFSREGYVWFSPDITKGKTERWTPVLPELEPVVADIRATVPSDHYVIASYRRGGGERDPTYPTNRVTIGRIVKAVARRAGIAANVYPHMLRHAYGDHIAKHAGLRAAQALMGHASVQTTASVYVDRPDLDELSSSVRGLRYTSDAPRLTLARGDESAARWEAEAEIALSAYLRY
ncbi:MAG TPA: tyrosine-type recombinase/integrase [Solirubrobacteraceae bacterium]|jgi:integrase/recombinase XerC|nr:tyrosine-type recombinase/integrase [Solirubrobacteraceae bacterium]